MRVIIATDAIGALRSARAGSILAEGWPTSDRTVVPIAEAGARFVRAIADQVGAEPIPGVCGGALTTVVDTPERLVVGVDPQITEPQLGIDREASSASIGLALADALASSRYRAPEVVVDVSANRAHDAGAGLLGALGATADVSLDAGVAGLSGVSRVELKPVRQLLAGRRLTLIVPRNQFGLPLLGLRGITSRFGRDQGWDPGLLLGTDATLQAFTVAAGPGERETDDWGACGGLGFVADLLDGRLLTGSAYCSEVAGLTGLLRGADLLVTGCGMFDFAERGGGVVARMTELGAQTSVPVILIAGEMVISPREMRAMGIESAYAVREAQLNEPLADVTEQELLQTISRVARSWTW